MQNKLILIAIPLALLLFVPSLLLAQEEVPIQTTKKSIFFLQGAFSLVSEIGQESDYVAGENDFPITPSHSEYGGGIGVLFNLSEGFGIYIASEYLMGATVTKEDPSDGETFEYQTYDNVNINANLMVKFGSGVQFFVMAGGGINILLPYANKEEEGSLGSVILIEEPETTINPMFVAGGGVLLNAGKMYIKLEAQYAMIFDYDKNFIIMRAGFGF
jgi:hypothetical protein